MAIYAEMYHKGVISNSLIPACGSDACVQIDARLSKANRYAVASTHCRIHGYLGFKILSGSHLRDAKAITPLYEV